jgi:hypothetical protein
MVLPLPRGKNLFVLKENNNNNNNNNNILPIPRIA